MKLTEFQKNLKVGDKVELIKPFRYRQDNSSTDVAYDQALREHTANPGRVLGEVNGIYDAETVAVQYDVTYAQLLGNGTLYTDRDALGPALDGPSEAEVEETIESIKQAAQTAPSVRMGAPKVVRDGKVAVIVSPGYGAGWSTWCTDPDQAVFAPDVVAWIEAGKPKVDMDATFGHHGYVGGLFEATLHWLPVGTRFVIDEYDGAESLVELGPDYGHIA